MNNFIKLIDLKDEKIACHKKADFNTILYQNLWKQTIEDVIGGR